MSIQSLQALTHSFEEAVKAIEAMETSLEGRLKFDLAERGVIFVDGRHSPAAVSNDNLEADCIVEIGFDSLTEMMAGRMDSRTAFQSGHMCLVGDMNLAFRLAELLNSANAADQ